ncbi:KpsF/GutQ family sugar-phosphate isomerase [Ferruginibacter sp. SUN002]|uniref:KpsF/GutQ family sugar-phosphate isomerase n=1 Tax=Ferruginibacter sp. SUN002 TaxID=2937789 RepID=UPI003D35FBD1
MATIQLEAESISGLKAFINKDFENALNGIFDSTGRVVVSGVGKSAIVAQKIAATFNSTGTPSVFMHGADAIHGDLGMVQPNDVVMLISKSGNSPEIKALVPLIKSFGNLLIGMVGNTTSFLASQSDIILNTTVDQEACPNNLAPTTSTTAQMVMGDTLAVCLMEMRNFDSADFAKFHPGGALGKKLYLKVSDIASQNERPFVDESAPLSEVIMEITQKRLGAAVVLQSNGSIAGIITDGDLRRMLSKGTDFNTLKAKDIMTATPLTIGADILASDAMDLMKEKGINQLIVVNENTYTGIIHLQDLVREGIF